MSWNSLWLILPIFILLIFGVVWFARKGRRKSGNLSQRHAPRKIGKKNIVFIIIVITFILAAGGFSSWWFILSKQIPSPEDTTFQDDKLIAEGIAKNFMGTIILSDFKERLEKHEIEKVYRQNPTRVSGIVIYYIKFKGENGYYLVKATTNEQVYVDTPLGKGPTLLDLQLSAGERLIYGIDISHDILTTVPRIPFDKNMIIFILIFVVVIVLVSWLLFGRMMRGGGLGGFGKANTPEMKKTVYFEDVGGVDEALEESKEVIELIRAKWGVKNVKK